MSDGGAAFPFNPTGDNPVGSWGMSLRDYFAGQALAGFCASPLDLARLAKGFPGDAELAEVLAAVSYNIADRMLVVREKAHDD